LAGVPSLFLAGFRVQAAFGDCFQDLRDIEKRLGVSVEGIRPRMSRLAKWSRATSNSC
jgi:hypothetical protein